MPTSLPPASAQPPQPRFCECPSCEEGWHRHENPSGDPRGPAIPDKRCPSCLGTGKLHVHCRECNDVVPWTAATPVDVDTIDEGYLCRFCQHIGENDG